MLSTWLEAQFLPVLNQRIKPTSKGSYENGHCPEFALRDVTQLEYKTQGWAVETSTLAIMVGNFKGQELITLVFQQLSQLPLLN